MTDTKDSWETIDLAAVCADDELLDAAAAGMYLEVEPDDVAIAALVAKQRAIEAEPLNADHTAALEHALGRPIPGPLFGGAR